MDLKRALKGQYHAGLAMLRQCLERCPKEVWTGGRHPRNFWRIAYHAIFYTHLYLQTGEEAFQRWDRHRDDAHALWGGDGELPPEEPPYSKAELLEYLEFADRNVDDWVDLIDLESPQSGFSWYSIAKLDHQLLNVRHLQGHVGQLSELLMASDVDIDWISIG